MYHLKVINNGRFFFLVIALYIFVFQNFMAINVFKGFNYADEVIAFFFVCCLIIHIIMGKKLNIESLGILIFLFIIVCLALLSTLFYGKQPIKNEILDLFALIKFPVSLVGAYCFFDFEIKKQYIDAIRVHVYIITILFAFLSILDLILNLFPDKTYSFYKHGMKSLRLIYGHPATLSVVCLLLYSVMLFTSVNKKNNRFYKVILVLVMFLTMRAKIIGVILVSLIIQVWVKKTKKRFEIRQFLFMIPILVLCAWGEIQSYYIINKNASRLVLTRTSIQIAKDFFPLGSGLASFGSAFSISPYSNIYMDYGIDKIWGISKVTAHDISDTFFPMILGQFGVFALCVYVMFVYSQYRIIQKIRIEQAYLAVFTLFVYMIIASTSESAFVNAYSVFFAVFTAFYIRYDIQNRGEE